MKWLVVDGHAVCYQVTYAMSLKDVVMTHDRIRLEVPFGFLKILRDVMGQTNCERVCFTWDSKSSDRAKLDPQYKMKRKSKRDKLEPEVREKLAIAYKQHTKTQEEMIPALGFNNSFCVEGLEADDLIASITANNIGDNEFIILSQDNDLYQLLNERVSMLSRGNLITYQTFKAKYGIEPSSWAMGKAIGGCDNDNVIGIQGASDCKNPKSKALSYIKGELTKGKIYDKITAPEGREMIKRNLPLVRLPFEGTPDIKLKPETYFYHKFKSVFSDLGFKTYLREMQIWQKLFNLM